MDNLEIGQWLLDVLRVSLLLFVTLIHMLFSGAVIKTFYLGRGGGRGGPKFLTNAHLPLPRSRLRAGKEKEGGGRSKQTKKIINQFGHKSDPAIIEV